MFWFFAFAAFQISHFKIISDTARMQEQKELVWFWTEHPEIFNATLEVRNLTNPETPSPCAFLKPKTLYLSTNKTLFDKLIADGCAYRGFVRKMYED
jgi:hypothetical protein